jgi:hypothetical protein
MGTAISRMARCAEISADNLGFAFALAFEGFDHLSGNPTYQVLNVQPGS